MHARSVMDPSVCVIGLPLSKKTRLTSLFYINNNKYKMFEWSLHLKSHAYGLE